MTRWLTKFRFALLLLTVPLLALAQTGDPTLDGILQYVPAKYLGILIGVGLPVWSVLYYIVCPIALKLVKADPAKPWTGYVVKAAEFITQNTHRPPPLDVVLKEKTPAPPPEQPKGFSLVDAVVALLLLALVALAVLWVRPAKADDPQAVTTTATVPHTTPPSVPFNVALGTWNLHIGAGFTGTIWDTKSKTFVQNVQMSGLAEFVSPYYGLGVAVGPAWQTGQDQGVGGTALLTLGVGSLDYGAGPSVIWIAGKPWWAWAGGVVVHY